MNEDKVSRQVRERLIERARQLRAKPTQAEALLWSKLRKRQLGGFRFRRQHIIHAYIVDFYCPEAKLVIEIDGAVHEGQVEYDQDRETKLVEMGYKVVRFTNVDVTKEIKIVLVDIYNACMEKSSKPGKMITKEKILDKNYIR
jgi:very-short-patch-repair endonuclease